jgi:mono/diheme cytochrome c family protein
MRVVRFISSVFRFAALAAGAVALASPTIATALAQERTAAAGVYTADQAARGKTRYFQACAACHGGTLGGGDDSPELSGKQFMDKWSDGTIGGLYAFIFSQMPVGRPGSLGPQGYADVLALILQANGFPPGQTELPGNETALHEITIGKKP